jgi:hypothetical protein
MTEQEIMDALKSIQTRRIEAFKSASSLIPQISTRELLEVIEDATTPEDIDTLSEARKMIDPFALAVLDLYSDVWQSFGKYRCSVCGMTTKQALEANYDCYQEC